MIVSMYPNQVQQRTRIIAVSLVISLAMACGFILYVIVDPQLLIQVLRYRESTVLSLIPLRDRGAILVLASWRWVFRFVAIVTFTSGTCSWLLFPQEKADHAESHIAAPWTVRVKRLDLVGIGLIMSSLLMLNLGLTSKQPLLPSKE